MAEATECRKGKTILKREVFLWPAMKNASTVREGSFSFGATRKNNLLHPTSSGFEFRTTYRENIKIIFIIIFTHFKLQTFLVLILV